MTRSARGRKCGAFGASGFSVGDPELAKQLPSVRAQRSLNPIAASPMPERCRNSRRVGNANGFGWISMVSWSVMSTARPEVQCRALAVREAMTKQPVDYIAILCRLPCGRKLHPGSGWPWRTAYRRTCGLPHVAPRAVSKLLTRSAVARYKQRLNRFSNVSMWLDRHR